MVWPIFIRRAIPHILPLPLSGNDWTGLDWLLTRSFFLFFFPLYLHLFLGSKAFHASDRLSSVEIRLGNGVIVSCVVISFTLHASQVIHICWLFFLDALTIFQLISVDLAAPYHFHIQCKGLHSVVGFLCFDLYLILPFGLYLESCL